MNSKELAARLWPIIFGIVLSCAVISFILISLKAPHGEIDAVSIWNLRSRFLARATDHWRDAFLASPSLPHPDYPLLLPTTIARYWKYIGHEPVVVPIVVAFLFTFSSVGLLCSSLAFLQSRQVGYLGGIVLLGSYSFVVLGAWQYADTVIGFFMLSSFVALALNDASPTEDNTGFLILGGAAAGFCGWTKNEGLLFIVLLLAVRLLFTLKSNGLKLCVREGATIMLGLIPVLAVVAYFKLEVAQANYYLKVGTDYPEGPMRYINQPFYDSETIGHKLTDVSRYWLIAKVMASEIGHFGGRSIGITPFLALYAICVRVKRNSVPIVEIGITVLALMLVGYYCVYLTTPLKVSYHLEWSLLRLLLQLWPSAVFVFFMATPTSKTKRI